MMATSTLSPRSRIHQAPAGLSNACNAQFCRCGAKFVEAGSFCVKCGAKREAMPSPSTYAEPPTQKDLATEFSMIVAGMTRPGTLDSKTCTATTGIVSTGITNPGSIRGVGFNRVELDRQACSSSLNSSAAPSSFSLSPRTLGFNGCNVGSAGHLGGISGMASPRFPNGAPPSASPIAPLQAQTPTGPQSQTYRMKQMVDDIYGAPVGLDLQNQSFSAQRELSQISCHAKELKRQFLTAENELNRIMALVR
jgi:hypothetical protein